MEYAVRLSTFNHGCGEVELSKYSDLKQSNNIIYLLERQYETTGMTLLKTAANELRRLYDLLDLKATKLENNGDDTVTVRMGIVMKSTVAYFGVTQNELTSSDRTLKVLLPRHVAIYVARQITDLSTTQIGAWFGNRDHTSILHACNKIDKQVKGNNTQIQKYVSELSELCRKEAVLERDRIKESLCQTKPMLILTQSAP